MNITALEEGSDQPNVVTTMNLNLEGLHFIKVQAW